jgi:hypothetical protein
MNSSNIYALGKNNIKNDCLENIVSVGGTISQ